MNDMLHQRVPRPPITDSEFLRRAVYGLRADSDRIERGGFPEDASVLRDKADRLEYIATKYESMARAVLWAYDEWFDITKDKHSDNTLVANRARTHANTLRIATGKHPSDWTRDGLMEYLGIAQEADE